MYEKYQHQEGGVIRSSSFFKELPKPSPALTFSPQGREMMLYPPSLLAYPALSVFSHGPLVDRTRRVFQWICPRAALPVPRSPMRPVALWPPGVQGPPPLVANAHRRGFPPRFTINDGRRPRGQINNRPPAAQVTAFISDFLFLIWLKLGGLQILCAPHFV